MLWGTGGVAAVVIALTGYAVFSGGSDTTATPGKDGKSSTASAAPSSAAPTYTTPDGWTEPDRWAALPRGTRTDSHGNSVGFAHTTEGAVAMLAAANSTDVEGSRSAVDEQIGIYNSYLASADQTPENAAKVKAQAQSTDASLRSQMGVTGGSVLPSGAYARNTVVGFKVVTKSQNEVSVWLLTRVALKTGETKKESDSYTRSLAAADWESGDWKLSSQATVRAAQQATQRPTIAAPGDAAFNDAGWTAIREAS
jgi:hypothetical protein